MSETDEDYARQSAVGLLRSVAETKADDAPAVPDGLLSYGTVRDEDYARQSAIGLLRSVAETKADDAAAVPDGLLSYGTVRTVMRQYDKTRRLVDGIRAGLDYDVDRETMTRALDRAIDSLDWSEGL